MKQELDFQIAQTLRQSHCDRKDHEHECVGEITIKRGEVCFNCKLCGPGEQIPGWCSVTGELLDHVFKAAGIDWMSLSLESRVAAVREYRGRRPSYQ